VVIALAVAAATAAAQPAPPPPTYGEALFVVSGSGYGHGVGMSQFGAYGQASAGRTYDEILTYYYTGVELGKAATRQVRVLLAEGRRAVTIGSTAPFTVRDAAGSVVRLPAGQLVIRPNLEIATADGPVTPVGPVVVRPARSALLSLDGRLYRGTLELTAQARFLRVVNTVSVESYLRGVVPGEMPQTWPLEALKAQAVAARSYALANLLEGKPFDLYADVRSQVYLGADGEKPRTTEAVEATAGEVVLYGGRVASTLYHASSGGRTASAADVFGVAAPYLVGKPDPWDKASPYYRWGPLLFGARTLQSKLAIEERVLDATGSATPSGRVRTVTVQTAAGTESVPASLVRSALGLRSTWLTIGVLRLDRPSSSTVVFGSSARLSGVARGLAAPELSTSLDGQAWTRGAPLPVGRAGAVSVDVTPARTTRYRLEVEGAASPALLVRVAPRLALSVPAEPGLLVGTIRPKALGSPVTIERRTSQAWVAVGKAAVEGGAFRAELDLVPGAYRARTAASDGLVAAVSPIVEIAG